MERNLGREMEQQKNYEQVRYNIVETRNEGLGSANQRFLHDPSSTINTNMRPPDFNMAAGARPVLNYSIQTGEEFALEFMTPRQHFIPNASGDPNSATNYAVLKGFLGASHTGSESVPEIPMLNSVEKSRVQEFERKGSSVHEDKGYYDSVRSVPQISSRNNSSRGLHGYSSSGVPERSSTKIKFLCSFGGKILPRPSDGKLRYVGGETRIIRMNKDISWQDLMQKTMTIYNQSHTIKYQLPGEDLDALVSVSCDEDLQNMMEECNVLEDGGSQKLRLFLFSSSDFDDGQFGLGSMDGDSEIQYVVAVNGMDLESRKNSIGLASTSGNTLEELITLNVERETGRVATELAGPSTAPLAVTAHSSTVQSSQPSVPNLGAYESNSKPYQGQKMHHGEPEQHQMFPVPHLESLHDLDGRNSVPFSTQFPYGYGSQPFNYGIFGENMVQMPLHGHMTRPVGVGEDHMHGNAHVHVVDPELSGKEEKLKRDNSSQSFSEPEKNPSLEKEMSVKDAKPKLDCSVQKMNELEKIQSLESEHNVSSHPTDGSIPNYIPREEASIVSSTADIGAPMLLPKTSKKHQESVQISKSPEAVDVKVNAFNGDGHCHTSGGALVPGYGDSEADLTEVIYAEQMPIPPRVFHSERIPREQAELNRLSKSDDSFSSQFLMSHARSDASQQVAESIDKLHGGNAASQSEQAASSTKQVYTNPKTVEDGLMQFEKYKDVADNIKKLNSNVSEDGLGPKLLKSEPKRPVQSSVDDHDLPGVKDGNKDPAVNDKEAARLNNLIASQGTSGRPHDDSPPKAPGFHWDELAVKKNNEDNIKGHAQPMAWTENPLRSVPGGESSAGAGAGTSERGDILIDINDRFPRDFLSDIFSKARISEGPPGITPLHGDGTGLSLNLENHEPKHWSFFQKLAQEEFARKGVSLMDQDHLGYPSPLMNIEEGTPLDYSFPPLKIDGVPMGPMDSRINFEEEIQQESSSMVRPNTIDIHEDFDPSAVKQDESIQMDGMVNPRIPDSDYEVH